ncbi:MAG: alanine/glycine:cation symporter family protein [Corynebacterium pyruviciproducens]|uniref:alanine/glycine:cation symporter family protein n=1 Tax=Corynebacterium pyruviciproducens TaxID=598660 RepID=UPI0023F183E8|nr:sodium:alanine symporter family protein [Corynebacterium pyruviciproducens]MDK7215379.1 sodium:alanine symporter family protein [Corynebacterium pyruviciproducens]
MESLLDVLNKVDSVVWGPFLLIPLLLGTGLWLTARLKGLQFRKMIVAFRHGLIDPNDPTGEGDISNYQALTTALAATVGVGNIVGVATALALGGPGALFWMWVTGLVGMASKYTEAFLGVRFREEDSTGHMLGGPMKYLKKGIGGKLGGGLSLAFGIFAVIASFGIGNLTQANAVATAMNDAFGMDTHATGALMFFLIGMVLLGGIETIGKVTSAFVPLMIIIYILGASIVLIVHAGDIPGAFALIFHDAFTGSAAVGGFAGSSLLLALQLGVARGIFSNESGMGSAAIAAAAAQTNHPVRQGLVSMTQTFIDTIVVVTFTGLTIITTGTWTMGASEAGSMTAEAFSRGLPGNWGGTIVSISTMFFAFSTIVGWAYYGERCLIALVGMHGSLPYRMLFTCVVFIGAISEIQVAWVLADVANGLMAIPNLIGLLLLSGFVAKETKDYLDFDPRLRETPTSVAEFNARHIPDWS